MIAERLQSKAIAYEPRFDQRKNLKASYISRQIDTFLGERLNVLLSKNKYEIKNNLVYGQDMEEPFVEVMKRGVDYRRKVEGENRADKKREGSEVEGFLKTQEVMCNPNTPIGIMILSISPQGERGSLYQHNFYDVFTLKEENGERFLEARRYSSALTLAEYKDKLKPLSYIEDAVDDAYFLSHPIKIDPSTSLRVFFENADQIHSYLHKNHDFMRLEDFQKVLLACEGLKQEYIQRRDPLILNAILNKADIQAGISLVGSNRALTLYQEIDFLGRQPVRTVATGCGSSRGFSSPFSVSDFGLDEGSYEFDQDGPCKKCGAQGVKCGPCGICQPCDSAIRASKNK